MVKRVVIFDKATEEKKARAPGREIREFCVRCKGQLRDPQGVKVPVSRKRALKRATYCPDWRCPLWRYRPRFKEGVRM